MLLEAALALLALAIALALRPWRLLAGAPALITPMLATLVVLPWLWALPALHRMPLQLQWSGAVLVLLMLGWPLAIPVLLLVGLAWGDAFVTGMLTAIFVAFKPQWLLTWSDARYLRKP